MTTRKGAPGGAKKGRGASSAKLRVQRPQAERTRPIRASAGSGSGSAAAAAGAINDSIARAVRAGYDVLAENIQQGRAAAERFRQGEYNIRDVPDDVSDVMQRLIQLARELSATTLDVCERLLKEVQRPAAQAPDPQSTDTPPFRTQTPNPPPPQPAAPAPAGATRMKLTVRFKDAPSAVARSDSLERPSQPTLPGDLVATPLAPRDPKGAVISQVSFETDVSVEGLIAVVTPPPGLAPGVYSGLVRSPHDDVPLGVLAVEIP